MRKTIIIALVVLGAPSNVFATAFISDCKYSRVIDRIAEIGAADQIKIEAGAGWLKVKGERGRNNVQIEAKLCASDEDYLDQMDVTSRFDSNTAHFETVIPDLSNFSWGNNYARVNVTFTVPEGATLEVEDSSGEASLHSVAKLSVKDSSGELIISDIAGDLKVVDSSGEINITDVGGSVAITDSSGAINADDVEGTVLVIADSSGAIDLENIGHDVIIRRDSSGAIEVDNVGGDFIVIRDSSGGIYYNKVGGKVQLPR